jgi:hypothetical protein
MLEVTHDMLGIVDRLQAHRAKVVQQWLAGHKGRIEVLPLPKHSSEMNADEYLNNNMKGNVKAERLPDNKECLRSLIQGFMRKLLHLPQHVMSYFQHPCVLYAAGP